jgi:hypothetical protein
MEVNCFKQQVEMTKDGFVQVMKKKYDADQTSLYEMVRSQEIENGVRLKMYCDLIAELLN